MGTAGTHRTTGASGLAAAAVLALSSCAVPTVLDTVRAERIVVERFDGLTLVSRLERDAGTAWNGKPVYAHVLRTFDVDDGEPSAEFAEVVDLAETDGWRHVVPVRHEPDGRRTATMAKEVPDVATDDTVRMLLRVSTDRPDPDGRSSNDLEQRFVVAVESR